MAHSFFNNAREKKIVFGAAFAISLFSTFFMWEFWRFGVTVLGINSLIYGLAVLGFFLYLQRKQLSNKMLSWLIPMTLIILGMGIYANLFTKIISVVLLPFLFLLFSTHEVHSKLRNSLWGKGLIHESVIAFFKYIVSVFESLSFLSFKKKRTWLPNFSAQKKHVIFQAVLGVLALFILAWVVIIPLLSSADATFANMFSGMVEFIRDILSTISDFIASLFKHFSFPRLLVTLFGVMLLLGFVIYFRRDLNPYFTDKELAVSFKKYGVFLSIVLLGVLLLYLIFIGIQIQTLFVGSLPIEFADTERLVKTGFWQLFLLTLINIIFYIIVYNKSTKVVQKILMVFTVASLLLVVSAAHRMMMYVYYYGLSYEKFYAFYTVLFCIGVFAWFVSLIVRGGKKVSVIKVLAFASLWMYSLTTIIPLERVIFATNLHLTQLPTSRININELRMLGVDALSFVDDHAEEILIIGAQDHASSTQADQAYDAREKWGKWHNDMIWLAEHRWKWAAPKKWYEKTVTELIYHAENPFKIESKN